ncbi:hypothetical protein FACS189418_6650 [Clostridia bacterium]|nr:hypothetical protein FACS189418_6650 [Clostridia bacterium]
MDIPVYGILGFADSGKTSFIRFTLEQEYFGDGSRNLLIVTEEGKEKYNQEDLDQYFTQMIIMNAPEQFNTKYLEELQEKYDPECIIIEYNSLWGMKQLLQTEWPKQWTLNQTIMTVCAKDFEANLNQMRSLFVEQIVETNKIIFNRCQTGMNLKFWRKSIKSLNAAVEVVFESIDEELEKWEEQLPYDITQNVIRVDEADYGIWYMDALEHPEHYQNKTIELSAMVVRSEELPLSQFILGRMSKTNDEENLVFIGFLCKNEQDLDLQTKQWIHIEARFNVEYQEVHKKETPVLYTKKIKLVEAPKEKLVYFT